MKNPCSEECLIVAACTEVCNTKINYGILVQGGYSRYQQYLHNNKMDPRFKQRTESIMKYYRDKSYVHENDIIKIGNRGRGLL